MNYFVELLSSYVENEALLRVVFASLIGFSVFAGICSLIYLGNTLFNPLRRRIAGLSAESVSSDEAELALLGMGKRTAMVDKIDDIGQRVLPKNEKELASVTAKLVRAGYRHANAVNVYYALKTMLCLGFGLAATQAVSFFPALSAHQSMMSILASAVFGLFLPNFVVNHQEKVRIKSIRKAFPDALDLFVVCVEAGLGLSATIQRVADEMQVSQPELADELGLVSAEMRLGVDRMTALRGLAERTGLNDIKGLVTMLDQSVRFGTGIAETLRVYADEFRDRRMQAAEEKAAKIATKMIFPLILCMWPSFFVVAVGPAVLQLVEVFQQV